ERFAGTIAAGARKIALVDGAVDHTHPALHDCHIDLAGAPAPTQGRAADHATFMASILVARDEDRQAGRVLGLCPGATLVNLPVVSDRMLTTITVRAAAAILAGAVHEAVRR